MGYEKRQFLYGMDLDTEERLIQPGFSRKNVNVRIGSSTDNAEFTQRKIFKVTHLYQIQNYRQALIRL